MPSSSAAPVAWQASMVRAWRAAIAVAALWRPAFYTRRTHHFLRRLAGERRQRSDGDLGASVRTIARRSHDRADARARSDAQAGAGVLGRLPACINRCLRNGGSDHSSSSHCAPPDPPPPRKQAKTSRMTARLNAGLHARKVARARYFPRHRGKHHGRRLVRNCHALCVRARRT